MLSITGTGIRAHPGPLEMPSCGAKRPAARTNSRPVAPSRAKKNKNSPSLYRRADGRGRFDQISQLREKWD
jgi:hypothetical protein